MDDSVKAYAYTLVATLAAISVSVALLRTLYPFGSISLLSLLPLFALIILGSYHVIVYRRRAVLNSIFTPNTSLRKFLKGRFSALAQSFVVAVIGLFFIAYKGLVAAPWELVLALASIATCSVVFSFMKSRLQTHIEPQYLYSVAANTTSIVVGTLFFFLYMYSMWSFEKFPSYYQNENLAMSLSMAMADLKQSSGYLAQIIEIVFAIDVIKSYAIIRSSNLLPIAPIVFVVYGAIFGFLQVKVIVSVITAITIFSGVTHTVRKE